MSSEAERHPAIGLWSIDVNGSDSGLLAARRAAVGGAASAGGVSSTFEFATHGKGKSGHHPCDLLALAAGTRDLFRGPENQLFEVVIALITVIFVNGHAQ